MEKLLERHNTLYLLSEIDHETLRSEIQKGNKRYLESIERDYCQRVDSIKRPRWQHFPGGTVLEDAFTRRPCILFPAHAKPVCLWPSGTSMEYVPHFELSKETLPKLPNGVVQHIFSYLPGEDLLSCRSVSKRWCRFASMPALWQSCFS